MKSKTPQIVIVIILLLITIAQIVIILDLYLDTYSLGIFNKDKKFTSYYKTFEEATYQEYLHPYRLIVKGEDSDFWIIHQSDSFIYDPIWDSYKSILAKAITNNPSFRHIDVAYWNDIYKNEGITIEFFNNIPFEFLALMINQDQFMENDETIEKIHIKPEKDNVVTIYIKTNKSVLEYKNVASEGYFEIEKYNNLVSSFKINSKYETLSYNYYSQILGNDGFAQLNINLDIPIILKSDAKKEYNFIYMDILPIIVDYNKPASTEEKMAKAEQIKQTLLGATYDKNKTIINANGDIVYSNEYNIFNINKDGSFKYKFTPSNEGKEKGNIKEAFLNSIELINKFLKLNSDNMPRFILSEVISEKGYYTFKFNYVIDDNIVLINNMNNAITVKANSTRALEASGILYNINNKIQTENKELTIKYTYNISTLDVIKNYNLNLLDYEVKDIFIGYVKETEQKEYLVPNLILRNHDGSITSFALMKVGEQ